MASLKRRALSRAFSLVELMVALVLMLVALAIASRLVLDAQASIAHSGRRHLDISVDQAFDQIRYDARSSIAFQVPFGTGGGLWARDEVLRFSGHISGDTIAYELVDGELVRHVFDPAFFEPVATRLMLRGVQSFRFRTAPNTGRGALEVEVIYQETAPLTARRAGGQAAAVESTSRVVGLVLTPRRIDRDFPAGWW